MNRIPIVEIGQGTSKRRYYADMERVLWRGDSPPLNWYRVAAVGLGLVGVGILAGVVLWAAFN